MEADPMIVYEKSILEKLGSYKLYDKFNEQKVDSSYYHYCNGKQVVFSKYDVGIYKICVKFAKNLKELDELMEEVNDSNERCRYLNFWTNDQIRKKLDSIRNVESRAMYYIGTAFYYVSLLVNGASSQNSCRYRYYGDFNKDLWKKWKELYDYIRNKDHISSLFASNNGLCKIYKEYYAHIKSIYQEYKGVCCGNYSSNCPFHIKFKEWCNMDNILIELECNEPVGVRESSSVSSQKNEEKTGIAEAEQSAKSTVERLDPITSTDYSSLETTEEPTNGNETNPVGTIVGTSLGFVVPLSALYKVSKNLKNIIILCQYLYNIMIRKS
ncbi:hypothetical protein PCYB_003390 [Plasmodium cynomolgi strain B]|uniref:CYIR protein n=1 Tax=Plasmodium cynomolgi (strain B) TaxID=1120755 RepID=K6V2S6_PLACD|nr:hypothetical protein PCYB_003390 [Plasmodium cynomolgi strain B]GAB69590.1 hypothetical protein PCYB_003390 [Plasmodium cynomolgi strain B]